MPIHAALAWGIRQSSLMNTWRIRELLDAYIVGLTLPPGIFDQLSVYLDLLVRWNAKTNLTAIRDPEQIVTRHFGESLFAASVLFGEEPSGAPSKPVVGLGGIERCRPANITLADLGSGAGFPGIPIKLAFPELHVTLIESQNKKATFLKEVIRALGLQDIEVHNGRAEQWGRQTDVVTLRAVEKFESVLPIAKKLVAPGGRICLLIGRAQVRTLGSESLIINKVERIAPGAADSLVLVGIIGE
jgi:16S rRNA (guanine527-N7)-methyltransferase